MRQLFQWYQVWCTWHVSDVSHAIGKVYEAAFVDLKIGWKVIEWQSSQQADHYQCSRNDSSLSCETHLSCTALHLLGKSPQIKVHVFFLHRSVVREEPAA